MSLSNFLTRTFLLNTDELEDRATLVLGNARDEEVTDITVALNLPDAIEIKRAATSSEAGIADDTVVSTDRQAVVTDRDVTMADNATVATDRDVTVFEGGAHVVRDETVVDEVREADDVAPHVDVEKDLAGGDLADKIETDDQGRMVFHIASMEPKGRVKLGVLVAPGQEGIKRSFAIKAECSGTVNGAVDRENISADIYI